MTPEMRDALQAVGCPVTFADGEVLRERGTFAPDMLLITQGRVDCILSDEDAVHLSVGPDTIVGEIGFLTGQGATATLRALGPVEALSLDARGLQRLRKEAPTVAADVLRHLANLLQKRARQNEGLLAEVDPPQQEAVSVVRCSTLDQKRTAQRVRYDVECLEAGKTTPFADHDEGIISDDLDKHGTAFIAHTGVQAVGMMRVNLAAESAAIVQCFPVLDGVELNAAAVITASALHAAYRDADLIGQFVTAVATFAEASGATSVLVPCAPDEAAEFEAFGFHPKASDANVAVLKLVLAPSGAA